jgi:hypothetical protein
MEVQSTNARQSSLGSYIFELGPLLTPSSNNKIRLKLLR